MHLFTLFSIALLGLSPLVFAQDNSTPSASSVSVTSPDFTGAIPPTSSPTGVDAGNTTTSFDPQSFGGGQPRYCRKGETLCKYKQDWDWHPRRDCCKPQQVCIHNQGCRQCPAISQGPHGGLITDVDFGRHARRETLDYWVNSPEECCSACSKRDNCSGFAWSVRKRKCYLSISDWCEPIEYRESHAGGHPEHVFVVGGSACSNWQAKYGGQDYDWFKAKSQDPQQQDVPGVDLQSA